MSNSVVITGIILIIFAGASTIPICRLIFKKSIVFKVFVTLLLPIDTIANLAFFVGARGIIHLAWAAPVAIAFLFLGYYLVSKMLRNPLNEMRAKVLSLSEGNVDISFDGKYQKGSNEMAQVMRMLVKLTDSLQNIASFARHIGKGELDTQYELLGDKDSLGKSMLDMQHNLQVAEDEKMKRQKEDEQRNWVTLGLAKFADILRTNNHNIEELCHTIISNLVKYLGANQGGIFILNDEDPEHHVLELKACYAYERRKFLQKNIEMGEGMVGTCFLERESIYMTDLPDDYIHITSGLGNDTPRALFITPLKINEEIYGVIEIAAFRDFEPYMREFVEKLAESIASTIGSVKVNIRTNKLLEQSRQQSEEMASQEEELRQNMEEMQATQEEMRRREIEQQETLNKMKELQHINEDKEFETMQLNKAILETLSAIEFSGNGKLESISPSALSMIGDAAEKDFVGRTFIETFLGGKEEGITVWEKLTAGERVTTYSKFGDIPLKLESIPVLNKQGQLQRVIAIAVKK